MDSVNIGGLRGEEYVCDSNEALEFKLVRCQQDLEDDSKTFKPEMSHQIFGDSESIFGYKDLQVKLYYTACRLHMFLGLQYSSKVDPYTHSGLQPDNVMKILQEKLKIPSVITNIDEFVKILQEESDSLPLGNKLCSFTNVEGDEIKQYEIHHYGIKDRKFMNLHSRLQTFIIFYIDAASYIDADDEKWQFFVVFESFKDKTGHTYHAVAGYCTVYEYFAYTKAKTKGKDYKLGSDPAQKSRRPRISQMLVLPPFQRRGLGARLLYAVYQHYGRSEIFLDITVEDPNEEFQQLRDYVDVSLCASLQTFTPDQLVKGFSSTMADEACCKYKINKKQARRVYEILRLKETNIHSDEEYSQYRLDIKRRLNAPFHKEANLKKRGQFKHLLENEPQIAASLGLMTDEQRFDMLQQMFLDMIKCYHSVLTRVARHPLPAELLSDNLKPSEMDIELSEIKQ